MKEMDLWMEKVHGKVSLSNFFKCSVLDCLRKVSFEALLQYKENYTDLRFKS